jgi:cytochrome c oxidase subunit 2
MPALFIGLATLLAAQTAPPAIPFDPLTTFIMVVAALVVLLIATLLTLSLARYRRPPDALPPQDHGNRRLEIAWTAAPAALVVGVFALTFAAMRLPTNPGAGAPPDAQPEIQVIGHQWWWEIRYPQAGVVTANVLHLPVGRPVLVTLEASVVQHNFWVPELGQKMDMYPGKVNHLWLEAKAPGQYQGVCAEFCGVQHAWMRILAVAQPPAEFDAWLAAQRATPAASAAPLAQQGLAVFAAQNCGSCHAIAGTAWNGQAGPNLSHFGSRPTISAGVLENTPENLARYLRDPQAVKPGIFMPNFRLSDEEIAALSAYLESLQ